MAFKLKVMVAGDWLIPDSRHELGGTDVLQVWAFRDIMPEGECHWCMREVLFDMARLHGYW